MRACRSRTCASGPRTSRTCSSSSPARNCAHEPQRGGSRETRAMIRRLLAVWHARNLEFLRDRSTLIFTLVVPIAIVVGMSIVFGGPPRPLFKVGVLTATTLDAEHHPFLAERRYIDFVSEKDDAAAMHAVARNQLDLLIDLRRVPVRYWVNPDSPKGYIIEKLLLQSDPQARREPVRGQAVRYVDWLFPGIL